MIDGCFNCVTFRITALGWLEKKEERKKKMMNNSEFRPLQVGHLGSFWTLLVLL